MDVPRRIVTPGRDAPFLLQLPPLNPRESPQKSFLSLNLMSKTKAPEAFDFLTVDSIYTELCMYMFHLFQTETTHLPSAILSS